MEEYLKNKTDFEDLAPQEKEPETDKEDEGPIFKLIPDADPETNTEPMAEDNNAKGKLNEDPGQAPMTEMTAVIIGNKIKYRKEERMSQKQQLLKQHNISPGTMHVINKGYYSKYLYGIKFNVN
eukprot:TRINITY_DN54733_c0_g1_i2.p2 TRINITY_DN54733_c0_g1~~TRINITY_DN54733_c0_g1_i2.p2  ORF type:complete len:124 (-),score=19.19 TRINITY_DN54733_c0_g1_i2:69-440(-)